VAPDQSPKDIAPDLTGENWTSNRFGLFAVGAASGTIISFELGLLWPRFMAFAGGIIGLPFSDPGGYVNWMTREGMRTIGASAEIKF